MMVATVPYKTSSLLREYPAHTILEMAELRQEVMMGTEEEEAQVLIWKYIFGFVEMAVVKCAIELKIPDTIAAHRQPMTLPELSLALGCSSVMLHRIMRFLVHQKIFKENRTSDGTKSYALTPLSRLFTRREERNMVDLVLLESSPVMLAPWHYLSARVLKNGLPPFVAAHGEEVWSYAARNPKHSELINNAMACDARVSVPAIIDGCGELFEGIGTIVDVGGGNGTTLRGLVKAFPGIKGINFDLPHVVSLAPKCNGVEHVGGDMFQAVPKADVAFLKWVLHDWGDDECVEILRKCREAIVDAKNGKVIIVEAVIKEEDEEDKFKHVGLMLDMVMMAHTITGKEKTEEEWGFILDKAGFSSFIVKPIHAVQSVIVAYP